MTPGQPDFVFTDEQDGVVALKHGEEILYASLYWRAAEGINRLARVHSVSPQFERIAVVAEDAQFEESGQTWARPDWTTYFFGNGGFKYPGHLHSAEAGEKLPIPKLAVGVKDFKVGAGSPYRGRADLYQLRYGPYFIAMNMSESQAKNFTASAAGKSLIRGNAVAVGAVVKLAPQTSEVLWLEGQ